MRRTLILIAALGLAGCPETASERQARDELQRIAEEREREQAAAEREAAEHLMTFGLVGTEPEEAAPAASAADLAAPGAFGRTVAGRNVSCAGMTDAEAFVRCLYAGIGEGWLNSREAPDGPAVYTDRTWTMGEEMRAAAPNWEGIEMLCLCRTPREVRLRSVRIIPNSGGAEAQVEISGSENERPRLDLVMEDGAWQVAEVRHDM